MMKAKLRTRSELSLVRNLIVTAFVILFFLGVIITYYGMLFTETRDNIILNGELNADGKLGEIARRWFGSDITSLR